MLRQPPSDGRFCSGEDQRIITEQYVRAQALLQGHHAALERLTQQLLKQETVDGAAVKQVLACAAPLPGPNGRLPTGLAVGAWVR